MGDLTKREQEIFYRLLRFGQSNKELADDLCVADVTIKAHLRSIFEKKGVRSRTELVARYARVAAILLVLAVPAFATEPLPRYNCFFTTDVPKGLGIGCYSLDENGGASPPHLSFTFYRSIFGGYTLQDCRIDTQGDGKWMPISTKAMMIILDNANNHRRVEP